MALDAADGAEIDAERIDAEDTLEHVARMQGLQYGSGEEEDAEEEDVDHVVKGAAAHDVDGGEASGDGAGAGLEAAATTVSAAADRTDPSPTATRLVGGRWSGSAGIWAPCAGSCWGTRRLWRCWLGGPSLKVGRGTDPAEGRGSANICNTV